MRTALLLAFLLAPTPAWPADVLGKVQALYYESARGVFLDARMLRNTAATRWADVDIEGRVMLVQLPAGMSALPGDMVSVRLGEPKSGQLARVLPTTVISRALEVNPQPSQVAGSARPVASAPR